MFVVAIHLCSCKSADLQHFCACVTHSTCVAHIWPSVCSLSPKAQFDAEAKDLLGLSCCNFLCRVPSFHCSQSQRKEKKGVLIEESLLSLHKLVSFQQEVDDSCDLVLSFNLYLPPFHLRGKQGRFFLLLISSCSFTSCPSHFSNLLLPRLPPLPLPPPGTSITCR